jgi:hypothetical protein
MLIFLAIMAAHAEKGESECGGVGIVSTENERETREN